MNRSLRGEPMPGFDKHQLEAQTANNPLAKEYNGKTVSELEAALAEQRQRFEQLNLAGHWLTILSIFVSNINTTIDTQIARYRTCLDPDSSLKTIVGHFGNLEQRAGEVLDKIAFNVFLLGQRINMLHELVVKMNKIKLQLQQERTPTFSKPEASIEEVLRNLSAHILDTLREPTLVHEAPNADAFIRITIQDYYKGRYAPTSVEKLQDIMTFLLLSATMKQSNQQMLSKPDLKKLRIFFHPDRHNYVIEGQERYDADMKADLEKCIQAIFRVVNRVYESMP
jgi:hypothetical protein